MNRRKFLAQTAKGLVLASAFRGFSPRGFLAHAEGEEADGLPHFFVHLCAQGGIDSPLGLNPLSIETLKSRGTRDEDFFFLYRDDDVRMVGNQAMKFGLAARPLLPYAQDMCVINGVLMNYDVPAHPGNINYCISGSTTPNAQTFAVQLAQARGDSARGVGYSKYTYPIELGNYSGPQVVFTDGKGGKSRSSGEFSPDDNQTQAQTQTDTALKDSALFFKLKNDRLKKAGVQPSGSQLEVVTASAFGSVNPIVAKIKADYPNAMSQGVECAAYFLSGSLKYAHIDVSDEFGHFYPGYCDTHHDHQDHPSLATKMFEIIAGIFEVFKNTEYKETGKSLFDLTTFVYTTEFGRTPYREGRTGSDHNPRLASFFVAGKGIQGGQTIGESHLYLPKETVENRSRLQGLPYSFSQQRALTPVEVSSGIVGRSPLIMGACTDQNCVDYIYPENVLKTVAQNFGLKDGTNLLASARTLPNMLKKG